MGLSVARRGGKWAWVGVLHMCLLVLPTYISREMPPEYREAQPTAPPPLRPLQGQVNIRCPGHGSDNWGLFPQDTFPEDDSRVLSPMRATCP